MIFRKHFALFLLIPLFAFGLHKYYISLCEIAYIEEKQSIQVILGVFIDDLEVTLNKDYDSNLYLATEREVENIDEIYEDYLNKNFNVIVNQQQTYYTFIGKKYYYDFVRFYLANLETPKLNSVRLIKIASNQTKKPSRS